MTKAIISALFLFMPCVAFSAPITIVAVGDIMLSGSGRNTYEKSGYDHPFATLKEILKSGDLVIGNLEAPLTEGGREFHDKKFRFKVPVSAAYALKKSGFTHFSLANNHIMDFGKEGLFSTLKALDSSGILHAGAGADLAGARTVVMYEVKGVRTAFLSYSLTYPDEFFANDQRAGTAPGYAALFERDIRDAKRSADCVIVSFHWGGEGVERPRSYQISTARKAIDAGADIVIGHHPHILQGVEYYGKGVIFYSLGNFAFGSLSRTSASSMIAVVRFDGGVKSIKAVPIDVLNSRVKFQPKLMSQQSGTRFIGEFNRISDSLGSRMERTGSDYMIVKKDSN